MSPRASPSDQAERLIELARAQGFARVGVCDASPSVRADELRAWLDAGAHATMTYLERNNHIRTNPAQFLEGARSFLVVADQYASRRDPPDPAHESPTGRIARYARGRDYHKSVKKRLHTLCDRARELFPEAEFRAFVDTAPLPERELAARADIGWIGKHTLVIHPRLGSYLLLGGVATTLDLTPPASQRPIADHCGSCYNGCRGRTGSSSSSSSSKLRSR